MAHLSYINYNPKLFIKKLKIMNFFKKIWTFILDLDKKGKKWIGTDGLLNMETSALLVLLLMFFFPVFWSMIFGFIIMLVKCLLDKSKGHNNEVHDLICAAVGVTIGAFIGFIL